ncbi:hypothetical protein [Rothia nasimurium]|uniref:hypothetical protein n=1 Tax=Rothia nasimurium TaxID=85336 RepID=UPI001F182F48|nr:hypothetical protein [Rothia nasimurium]
MSTTSQQQTPPAPALTDTELAHLATALTGYTTSAHPAYRAAAARTALDALASIKAHIWESAAAHLECTQHLEAAALLWSAQPYYAPRPCRAPATLEQVRNVLAHHQPAPAPQQDKTTTLRAALDTLTSTPLESITAAIQLTDSDRAALAALAAARLDTCPVCADLLAEDSPAPFCSIFCQQQHSGTSA